MSPAPASQHLMMLSLWSLLFSLTAAGGEDTSLGLLEASHLSQLNNHSFEATVAKFDAVVVEFVRPFCDICNVSATLEFRLASIISRSARDRLQFAFIDGEKHESIAQKLKIETFPTTVLFLHSSPVVYRGLRDPESLLGWVKSRRSFEPPSIDAHLFASLKLKSEASLVFVGQAGRELDVFKRFAKTSPSVASFYLNSSLLDASLQTEVGLSIKSWSVVLVGLHSETLQLFADTSISLAGLSSFVERHRHPLVDSFASREALERVFYEEGSSIIYLSSGVKDRFIRTFGRLARANRDTLKFFTATPEDLHTHELTEYLGLPSNPPRQLWIIQHRFGAIDTYRFGSKLSPGAIRAFLKRFFSGQLVPGVCDAGSSSIVWDMADPEVVLQLRNSNATIVVFNYMRQLCRRRVSCRLKLRTFKRFAARLHNIPGLEFGLLNLGRGYRTTAGRFYHHFRTAMPALSVSLPHLSAPLSLPYFDWTFQTLQKWVSLHLAAQPPPLAT